MATRAGREWLSEVQRAVTAGALPDGAGGEWSRRLGAHRRRLRVDRAGTSAVPVLGAVLVTVASLVPEGPGGWGLLLAAGLLPAGGPTALRRHRRLQSVDRCGRSWGAPRPRLRR